DGQRRRGGDRVVIRRRDDYRVGDDDELADGRESQRRDESELARPERGVGGGGDLELGRTDARFRVLRRRPGDDLGGEAGAFEQNVRDAAEIHLPFDGHVGGRAALHRDGGAVGDHGEGGLGGREGSNERG